MKGRYINLQGDQVEILQHDEQNKIVYIRTAEGEQKWVSDADCGWWRSLDAPKEEVVVATPEPEPIIIKEPELVVEEVIPEPIPEPEPTPVVEEKKPEPKPKPKATKKGKK